MEPIQLIRTYTGELYANVNGVARSSIACRFDESGALVSHSLYGDKLVPKLLAVIAARGLVFPDESGTPARGVGRVEYLIRRVDAAGEYWQDTRPGCGQWGNATTATRYASTRAALPDGGEWVAITDAV
jgi:hypothetical protein